MLKTKYEYNFYSFYDHTGMEQHFEKMAAQAGIIEKLSYFWRYRRIGPQALRFFCCLLLRGLGIRPDEAERGRADVL